MKAVGKIFIAELDDVCVIRLVGDIRVVMCSTMESTIQKIFSNEKKYQKIYINLTEAEGIDSTSLGLLAKIALYAKTHFGVVPTVISTNPSISKLLKSIGFPQIFNILTSLDEAAVSQSAGEVLLGEDWSEDQVREAVIEAHKLLMALNDDNKKAFRELVESLENEGNG